MSLNGLTLAIDILAANKNTNGVVCSSGSRVNGYSRFFNFATISDTNKVAVVDLARNVNSDLTNFASVG